MTIRLDPAGVLGAGRAYQLRGTVLAAWHADPGPWQPLGDERAIAGGVVQHFVHRLTAALATICSHPHTGTWWVTGRVRDKWYEAGAQLGRFAWPVGPAGATIDQRGSLQPFAVPCAALPGAIASHPERGTYLIAPEIHAAWSSAGSERSFGLPDSDTRWSSDGEGRFSWYRGAVRQGIYWSKRHGTVLLPEAILSAWRWLGGEQSDLGYPVSGLRTPGQPGPSEVVFERGVIRADTDGRLEIEAHGARPTPWPRSNDDDRPLLPPASNSHAFGHLERPDGDLKLDTPCGDMRTS